MSLYLRRLISQGEHQQQDFKFAITDSKKIARSLSAFSNTDGGRLLIGVKDNGNIAGVRSDEEYYMIEAAAALYCRPEVAFEAKSWEVEGKTVLEIKVEAAEKRPVVAPAKDDKWMAFVRVDDQNFLANKIQVEVWKRQKTGKPVAFSYSSKEKKLLAYLSKHPHITFSKFCRIARIPRQEAEKTLINLIVLEIIQIHFTEKGALYSLRKKNEASST